MLKKCTAPIMKKSIGSEKIVFMRDASAARRPASAAFGSACPPASTFRALAMTIFWFRQMTPQTFRNIVMPSSMPVAIATPAGVLK